MIDWALCELTRSHYAYDFGRFRVWCKSHRLRALPASEATVLRYLSEQLAGGAKITSVSRYGSGINNQHREAGYPKPVGQNLRSWLAAQRRSRAEHWNQKSPLRVADLRLISERLGADRRGIRDRALLLLGFASALRRINLARLELTDIRVVEQGLILTIRREKQDRKGDGRVIGVARGTHPETCPVAAVAAWMKERGDQPGALFQLCSSSIALRIKSAVEKIGLDPATYSGHSLRAGFVTSAIESNVNEIVIASQTGHRSLGSLRHYYRSADPFRGPNASAMVGL